MKKQKEKKEETKKWKVEVDGISTRTNTISYVKEKKGVKKGDIYKKQTETICKRKPCNLFR